MGLSYKLVIRIKWIDGNYMTFFTWHMLAMYPPGGLSWGAELKEQGDGDTPCGLVAFACWQQSKSDCQQCHKNGSIHCDDLYSVFCGILP